MRDDFADLEEPKSKGPMVVLFAFGLMGVVLVSRFFTTPSPPIEGVVESIQSISVAKDRGSSVEDVSVRLTDGTVVLAQVANGRALQVGDQVRVMEQPQSASGPAYQVIAKDRVPAP